MNSNQGNEGRSARGRQKNIRCPGWRWTRRGHPERALKRQGVHLRRREAAREPGSQKGAGLSAVCVFCFAGDSAAPFACGQANHVKMSVLCPTHPERFSVFVSFQHALVIVRIKFVIQNFNAPLIFLSLFEKHQFFNGILFTARGILPPSPGVCARL
jgi:hypothetical protein